MDNKLEVAKELGQLNDEIESIMLAIEEAQSPDKSAIQARYAKLKHRLRSAAKIGTVTGEKRTHSESEEFFYAPAVEGADRRLKARTNGSVTDIYRSLSDASVDIATMLSQVQDAS